ncbi:putative disease resistance RPP13-like protein 2 [Ziziphus jujuba]|uniref:Disease resistance RPP13-like protein 2 n=1 Tax=Ziziphus jujuba TaxID=326968 RepID=A0ABM4A245_ZIZJJ|nr:putative disease resistance RPP13-like protein 2 [Ziziphus jujuba]XP_060670809.1 putative disease resistance RPP13-like protein 2 [Ziziphus jujuba]XP_060670810.1 putative disease resistance RPP13-like protein 2 [Ziziphus jujuba]XP_060670811.1 putative disease resistance RPP13-like protein 2 [Ziziphus jujuba]
MMKDDEDDECWLETTQVDIQLSCAIQKLEEVLAVEEEVFLRPTVGRKIAEIKKEAFNLGNLTRHSKELFGGFEEYIYVIGEGSNPLNIFEKEVLNLAYQVEDATSSFFCRREMRKKRQQGLMKKMMLFNNLSDQHDDMLEEIMEAKNAFISSTNFSSLAIDDANSLFSAADMLPRKATDYNLKFGRSNFVCCEEKRGGKNSPDYHLWGYLTILGEVGSGKTTFARDIYSAVTNEPKQGFEIRAWVSVRPEYEITDIYTDIVQQQEDIPNEIVRSLGSQGLSERLKKWLESCRFIIVLDDVHYIWSQIKSHFKYLFPIKTTQCSTVIITTCEAQASEITRVIKVLGPLSEKDRWELFKNTLKKANMINQIDKQDDATNRLETELPKGIICQMNSYLHLGIITLARLYMTNKHDNQKSSSSLSLLIDWDLNFQRLPPKIRQCFLYMGIFPEKFEIPIRRLFRLWIAEGLVVAMQSSETPEDLARSYLMELETKKLISVNRKNGHPKSCCMPSAMHKFFSRKAMHLGIFYVHNGSENPSSKSRARRLVEHAADIQQYPTSDDDYKLRSYISFNNRKRDMPAQQVGVFLGKLVAKNGFGLLRVLDLENVYKPLLPAETLEKLFLLTYLGLRWTFLDSLPDSVGTLQ